MENSINLNKSIMQKIKKLSKKTGESIESILEDAINWYSYELKEDLRDEKKAKRISAQIASGKMKTFSLAEVRKDLGF